jgi:hypothetical protein
VPPAGPAPLWTGGGLPAPLPGPALLVHAAEGAALLDISHARFARLARGGCLAPVDVGVSRHRVVLWRYAAAEVCAFGTRSPALLRGPVPEALRTALRRGEDHRPRRWRARRTARLVGQAGDPWRRAAALAAVLDPPTLAADVPDDGERALLHRLRPPLPAPVPAGEWQDAGRWPETARLLLTATDPEEIRRYRAGLGRALREARGTPAAVPR